MLHELVAHDAPVTVVRKLISTNLVSLVEQTLQFGLTVLHCAIQREMKCRMEVVELLIISSNGLLLHIPTIHGSTPLFLACQLNCTVLIVNMLIMMGSDVNTQCYNGATPISICAEVNANPELVHVLVAGGADVNKPKFDVFATPLYVACDVKASLELVRALCECGASCTSTAMEGSTPLHIAAQKNVSPQLMSLLIEFGGDVNQPKNVRVPCIIIIQN